MGVCNESRDFEIIFTVAGNHYKNSASGSSRRLCGNVWYLQCKSNPYFIFKKFDCSYLFSICCLVPCSIYLDPTVPWRILTLGHTIQAPLSFNFPLGLANWICWQEIKTGEDKEPGIYVFPSFILWHCSNSGCVPLWEQILCGNPTCLISDLSQASKPSYEHTTAGQDRHAIANTSVPQHP